MTSLGKTLLIVNPAAQNGCAASAGARAVDKLQSVLPAGSFDFILTEAPFHGKELAAGAVGFDTVLALGGDGLVHEVVNGLMKIDPASRPALGILPMGSGNDFAHTVGMSFTLERSLLQILNTEIQSFDLGLCNGQYFVETLSFGLDAAIAHDTVERRKRTGRTGTLLFVESGLDMLLHHIKEHRYTVQFDAGAEVEGSMLLFAVQVGPTYGGGFKICPEAKPNDGLFDLCIAHPPLGIPKAVMIFLLAKNAYHTHFKNLDFKRAAKITISFEDEPPAQIDGEAFSAKRYEISTTPAALRVLVPCS